METHDQRVYDSNPLGLKYYHNEDDFQEEDTGDSGNLMLFCSSGSFRYLTFGVLIIRILLFRIL